MLKVNLRMSTIASLAIFVPESKLTMRRSSFPAITSTTAFPCRFSSTREIINGDGWTVERKRMRERINI
jgi:hypothetical protein